jgi:hypothetical protein
LVRGASYFNVAAPSFWVALLAIFVFAVWLGWLPRAGASDPRSLDSSTIDLRYLILPAFTLALTQFAWFTMFLRDTLGAILIEVEVILRLRSLSRERRPHSRWFSPLRFCSSRSIGLSADCCLIVSRETPEEAGGGTHVITALGLVYYVY